MNRLRVSGWLQGLVGAALLIAVITVVSRIIGFTRWIAQAHQVGTTEVGTAYAAANTLPNILFEVAAGGALAGVIVPVLAGVFARKEYTGASRIASALMTWMLAILLPLGVLVAVLAPWIVELLPIGQDPTGSIKVLTTFFLRTFSVQIPLYGIAVLLGGILQAQKKFVWPALSPAISSVVVIGGYFIFGHYAQGQQNNAEQIAQQALDWLAWGTNAGVAAMALCMVVPVLKSGVSLRIQFRLEREVARRTMRLAAAGLGALVAQQASILVVMVVALKYGTVGTLNIFQYAQAVYFLPYAVLAVPLATSAFPRIAAVRKGAEEDRSDINALLAKTTRTIIAVSLAGAAALIVVADHIEAIFEHFTVGGAAGLSIALAWMAPGLIGYALIFHISRCLYSLDAGAVAAWTTILGWSLVAGYALVSNLWTPPGTAEDQTLTVLKNLGLATTIGMTVAGGLLLSALLKISGKSAGQGIFAVTAWVVVALGAFITVVKTFLPSPSGGLVSLITQASALALTCLLAAGLIVAWQGRRSRVDDLTPASPDRSQL